MNITLENEIGGKYKAKLDNGHWEIGTTREVAIGKLVISHPELFNVTLIHIDNHEVVTDENFPVLLNDVVQKLGLSHQEIGDLLHISQPTVQGWLTGKNSPYGSVKDNIIKALRRKLYGQV